MAGELEFLYQAMDSPLGICLVTSDIRLAHQRLHKAKRESGDPALDVIQIRTSPLASTSEIWLTRGKKK